MDPDKARARMVELAERFVQAEPENIEWETLMASSTELAETFLGLDEWLRKGGFLPQPWKQDAGGRA